jgi:AraC-like DNA-binding protein
MAQRVVTVSDVVTDRKSGRAAWAVVAGYVMGPQGDPVCVDYRVRQVASAGSDAEATVEAIYLAESLESQSADPALNAPAQPSARGIPRYVFEQASQGRMLEAARKRLALLDDQLARDETARKRGEDVRVVRRAVAPDARALLAASTGRRTGRPPQRPLAEKLRILAAVEEATAQGRVLADIAADFHMSRSTLRNLLFWARKVAEPRLFTARGQGLGGGGLTDEARALLAEIERGDVI